MLPSLTVEAPASDHWQHEIKHDGFRTLLLIDRGQAQAFTRNRNDWTARYPGIVSAATKLRCQRPCRPGEPVSGIGPHGRERRRNCLEGRGQRRSDVHRMTWPHVTGDTIKILQQKTRTPLDILIHKDLRAILAVADGKHVTILNTEYGRPFSVDGFSQWMRDAIRAAGLPLDWPAARLAQGRRSSPRGSRVWCQ